jgi:hypothetical protein
MIAGIALLSWLKTKREGYNNPAAKRIRGGVRLAAYSAVVALGFGALSLRSARAESSERLNTMGRELEKLSSMFGEESHMRINGQDVFLAQGSSAEGMGTVLDRFEKYCRTGDGIFKDVPAQMGDPANTSLKLPDISTIRKESQTEGSVMCLVKGKETGKGLVDSFEKFAATQDLGSLGKVRFAHVNKSPGGKVHIMMLWTEDSFKFDELFPEGTKEGRGHDPQFAPRPPDARRFMTVDLVGGGQAAYIFETKANKKDVRSFYDQRLQADGWIVTDDPMSAQRNPQEMKGAEYRLYIRDGQMISMTANENEEGSTSVALSETGISGSLASKPLQAVSK